MRAAVLHAFGQSPVVEEVADPVAGPDEVSIEVAAAAVHPIVKALASGQHYASPKSLPVGCGLDGVGRLADGTRVYFGPMHAPHGSIAERAVIARARCLPVPDGVDDSTAAALVNPGFAAWLPLTWRARLAPGESVCILGATGTAGRLAVRSARLLGAGRVVAAGRNRDVLASLGADAVIALEGEPAQWTEAFAREAGNGGFDVVIDYLWGRPAEALLATIARAKFVTEMRWVQVGESAGPTVSIPGGVLRSTGLSMMGFGLRAYGIAPPEVVARGFAELMGHAASGALGLATEAVALSDIARAWSLGDATRRVVVTPR